MGSLGALFQAGLVPIFEFALSKFWGKQPLVFYSQNLLKDKETQLQLERLRKVVVELKLDLCTLQREIEEGCPQPQMPADAWKAKARR